MPWFGLLTVESLALTAGIIVLLRYLAHRKWQYFADRNIPTDVPSFSMLGTLGRPTGQKLFTQDVERKQRLGSVYGVYAMWNPILVIHDLEIMKQIYTKEFKHFPDRQAVLNTLDGKEMDHGLTVACGKDWKRARTTLSPTFTVSKLRHTFSVTQQCVVQTLAVLKQKCEVCDGVFTPRIVFSNLSLDVIVSAALGTKTNPQALDGDETQLAFELRKTFNSGFFNPVATFIFMFPFLEPIFCKFGWTLFPKSSLSYIANLVQAVIEKRKTFPNLEVPKDLLQLMLDAAIKDEDLSENSTKGLTQVEIVGNAMLMVGAGFENTANSMQFLAYNLAFHPEVQERLQKEVDDVASEMKEFDSNAINGMKYMEMCINESMRLYQPIYLNSRVCRKETTVCGLTIPKDMTVNFPVFGLSHDPEHWDKPWEFRPERMEDMSQIDPMIFQPFGAGPRNCIGLRFALMEIKIAFFMIMQKFTFEPCKNTPKPPLELDFAIGVRPKQQIELRAVPRKTMK